MPQLAVFLLRSLLATQLCDYQEAKKHGETLAVFEKATAAYLTLPLQSEIYGQALQVLQKGALLFCRTLRHTNLLIARQCLRSLFVVLHGAIVRHGMQKPQTANPAKPRQHVFAQRL